LADGGAGAGAWGGGGGAALLEVPDDDQARVAGAAGHRAADEHQIARRQGAGRGLGTVLADDRVADEGPAPGGAVLGPDHDVAARDRRDRASLERQRL